MSASHRKISRLPVVVFQELITRPSQRKEDRDPTSLRSNICHRLKRVPLRLVCGRRRRRSGSSSYGINQATTTRIQTVGELLRVSKYALLLVLDPLLTYEEIELFLSRVCCQCTPKPMGAHLLLRSTEESMDRLVDQRIDTYTPSPPPPTPWGERMRYLPTGLASLDKLLRGGVRVGTITEVVGRSGVGKTQLALQLCIMATKYNQGSVYVETEKKLSVPRLKEMTIHWQLRERGVDNTNGVGSAGGSGSDSDQFGAFLYDRGGRNRLSATTSQEVPASASYHSQEGHGIVDEMNNFKRVEDVLDNVYLQQPGNSGELLKVLASLEDEILRRNDQANHGSTMDPRFGHRTTTYPVRLLIVDSIAAPMRRDFGTDSAPQRASAIFQCAQILKRLADQLRLAVVVINQVGSDIGGGGCGGGMNGMGMGRAGGASKDPTAVKAALGTSWHHCVSTRLVIDHVVSTSPTNEYCGLEYGDDEWNATTTTKSRPRRDVRRVSIVKSNLVPLSETQYEISKIGIVEAYEKVRGKHLPGRDHFY